MKNLLLMLVVIIGTFFLCSCTKEYTGPQGSDEPATHNSNSTSNFGLIYKDELLKAISIGELTITVRDNWNNEHVYNFGEHFNVMVYDYYGLDNKGLPIKSKFTRKILISTYALTSLRSYMLDGRKLVEVSLNRQTYPDGSTREVVTSLVGY